MQLDAGARERMVSLFYVPYFCDSEFQDLFLAEKKKWRKPVVAVDTFVLIILETY